MTRHAVKKIKVLVADDHPVFRDGLCRLLQDEEDIDVVGLAGDGEEAVQLAEELMPDVAIIDVTMPKVSGIGAARQIKTETDANQAQGIEAQRKSQGRLKSGSESVSLSESIHHQIFGCSNRYENPPSDFRLFKPLRKSTNRYRYRYR